MRDRFGSGYREIEDEITRLSKQLASVSERICRELEPGGDLGDQANDRLERTLGLAIHDCLMRRRRQLDRALSLASLGQAGVCETCGCSIDVARLGTTPGITRCLRCQRRLEQGLGRHSQAQRSQSTAWTVA